MSRRSNLDKGSVTGGLVNEAYEKVKAVADNLDAILAAGDTVLTFNGTFYNPRTTETNFDDLGDPSTIGDSYFNTAMGVQRIFGGTVWQDSGAILHLYHPRDTETDLNDQGNPSQAGDSYFNTVMERQRVYNGATWQNMGHIPWFYQPRAIETNLRDDGTASLVGDTYYNTVLLAQRSYLGGGTWTNQGSVPTDAAAVNVIDAGGYFVGTQIEAIIAEIGAEYMKHTNGTLTDPTINGGVSGTAIDTDDTLAADSDTILVSQKAIAAHVRRETLRPGDLYLIENRNLPVQNTHEFPSVFGSVDGIIFSRFIIRIDDLLSSHDNQEIGFQLTHNDGSTWLDSGYRPEEDSYIFYSLISDPTTQGMIFYAGCAGMSAEIDIRNSGVSSGVRGKSWTNYPHFVAGSPNQYNRYEERGFSNDSTGTPTGFRIFQDTAGNPGPGLSLIGTLDGFISVYGVISSVA